MFNASFLGVIAKQAKMKQDLKASQAAKPAEQKVIIRWPGAPVDGMTGTIVASVPGERIVLLASGRKVSVPPTSLEPIKAGGDQVQTEGIVSLDTAEEKLDKAQDLLDEARDDAEEGELREASSEARQAAAEAAAASERADRGAKKLAEAAEMSAAQMDVFAAPKDEVAWPHEWAWSQMPDNYREILSEREGMTAERWDAMTHSDRRKVLQGHNLSAGLHNSKLHPQVLAAPKAKEKGKDTDKTKKVVPDDEPDTRGTGKQEEELTDRAKERSTEIEKPPVLEHMKKGPKAVPVETARTAPEASEGLKTLVAAAEAAGEAVAAAAEAAKEAQAKLGQAKSEEAKKVQAVVDDMEKTGAVVAKIGEKLVALDKSKNVAAVNMPKSGTLRARYEQALASLQAIQAQAKKQAEVVKAIEAEAEEQYGGTYNVQKRVSVFPASMQAALAAVAGLGDLIKSIADWAKNLLGLAEEAETAVDGLDEALGEDGSEGQESKVAASIKRLPSGRWKDTNGNSYETAEEAAEAEASARVSELDPKADPDSEEFISRVEVEKQHILDSIQGASKVDAGFGPDTLTPADHGIISAFVDANYEDAKAEIMKAQNEEVSAGRPWGEEQAYEVAFDFLAERFHSPEITQAFGVMDDGNYDEFFEAFDAAMDDFLKRLKADGGIFETMKFPELHAKMKAAKGTSEGAQEFISEEIDHLIKDKGYEPDRAKGAAYNIARRKGYKVSSKPKAALGFSEFEADLELRTGLTASDIGIDEAAFGEKVAPKGSAAWISGFIAENGLHDLAPAKK